MGFSNGGGLDLGASYLTTGLWAHKKIRYTPTAYSASGIIPTGAGVAVITKATAAAMTLGAPTVAQDGDLLIITSETAAAHTVTATTLLANGLSGTPWTTATFAAQIGATLTLMAANGLWNVIAQPGVTIT